MIDFSAKNELDALDLAVLRELQADGRISNVALARRIGLSAPACHARVRRLEEQGYIDRYVALLDREKMHYDLLCFISVGFQLHQYATIARFRQIISELPEVLECHHITGEYDYLLKVAVHNRSGLERFVVDRLTPIEGVARIHTSIVLSEVKATTALPL